MRRLGRRSRSASRAPRNSIAGSLSCTPRSLLCRAWSPPSPPPATEASPVFDAISRPRTSTEINHVDRRESEVVERLRKNAAGSGAVLLGGNGLQYYDRFIATLLRERSAIKDGVRPTAVDQPQINKPPSLTTRRRKRRPLTNKVECEHGVNGFDKNSLQIEATRVIDQPADGQPLLLESEERRSASAVGASDAIDKSVHPRRPETTLTACWSPIETDVARGTSMKIDTMECSPRQRRRRRTQRDRYRSSAVNGSCTASRRSEKCDSTQSRAQDVCVDCRFPKSNPAVVLNHSKTKIPTHVDVAMSDRRQGSSGGPNEDCAVHGRFDGYDIAALDAGARVESSRNDSDALIPTRTDDAVVDRYQDRGGLNEICTAHDRSEESDTATSHSVGYKLSRRSTATASNDSESRIPANFDKAEINRRHDEGAFGLTDDASMIQFIDSGNHRVELFELETQRQLCVGAEDRTCSTLLPTAMRRNVGGDALSASSPSPRAFSQQCCRQLTGACMRNDVQMCRCAVARRSSSQCGEWTSAAPLRRHCRSQPLLTRSPAEQTSSTFDQTLGQLTRGGAHQSQLLETCRCSISKTSLLDVVKSNDADSDDKQSRQPTHGLFQSNIISITPQLNLQLSDDIKHSTQQSVNLLSDNVHRLIHRRSSRDEKRRPTHKVSVDRHAVQVLCVAGRCRQNGRCGSKTSRCLLRTEFVLTRVQTEDQTTTLLFAHRTAAASTADEYDQVVAGDSDVLKLTLNHCSTCCASDVTQTVVSDDSDDVVNDNKQSAVKSMEVSQPGSVNGAFNVSRERVSSVNDTVRIDVDAGTVDGVAPFDVISGDMDDVSQSLTTYEFAEVTSIFRNFADDLLPTTGRELSMVPYGAATRCDRRSTTRALVRRAGPGVTYSGAVVPYGTPSPLFVPLPLMTWTWNHDDFTGSRLRTMNDGVIRIPYVSACTTVDIEPSFDRFTLITPSSHV